MSTREKARKAVAILREIPSGKSLCGFLLLLLLLALICGCAGQPVAVRTAGQIETGFGYGSR